MDISVSTFTVTKRVALTISRGTNSESHNVLVKVSADGIEGIGEATPLTISTQRQTTQEIVASIEAIVSQLAKCHPTERQKISETIASLPSAACCAIDVALWDWFGKSVNLPLWRVFGLDRDRVVPISVTIGINTPEGAVDRLRKWQEVYDGNCYKIKLGNPAGIEADRAMFAAIVEAVPEGKLTVDANGGWSLSDAIIMANWLAERRVTYIEQPLHELDTANLPALRRDSPLPIFVDENCFDSRDVVKLAESVDGVNLKLMKTGGLSECMKSINVARACGLQVMFGCYSDCSISNNAAAQLSPLADYLDLDSHLNLIDDPFQGATLKGGKLILPDLPGIGIVSRSALQ
jgi:L-Ala-D/L-Glu epimerase